MVNLALLQLQRNMFLVLVHDHCCYEPNLLVWLCLVRHIKLI
jgi:hypothetical protein